MVRIYVRVRKNNFGLQMYFLGPKLVEIVQFIIDEKEERPSFLYLIQIFAHSVLYFKFNLGMNSPGTPSLYTMIFWVE